jgi:hypothetical protein
VPGAGRARASSSRALRNCVAFIATFGLTAGLWIAHHLTVWGTLESDLAWPENAWPVHTFGGKLWRAVEGLYRSTWAQVGWLPGPHSPAPPAASNLWPRPNLETPIFALMLPFAIIGLVGSIVLCVRWLHAREDRGRGLCAALLIGAWGLSYAAVVHRAIYVHPGSHEAARYALQAVAPTMGLLAIGPLVSPRRWAVVCWMATAAVLALMVGVSFFEMHAYLIRTFAP